MSGYWVLLVFLLASGRALASVAGDETGNALKSDKKVNFSDGSASEIVRKVIAKGCSRKYTMTCFKMDMVELVDLLSETKRYQLFPGVAVVKDNSSQGGSAKKLPEKLIRSLARDFPYGEDSQLDEFLVNKISDYLSTHSVSLKLMDPQTAEKTRALGDEIFGAEGRGKGNKGYGSLIAGVMMMKGTLMTIGFGALAALAGKALMTGLLSLMLSAILGLKSASGGGHKQTTYEIISKPVYSHSHSHSSEVQHDHHDHGHGHGASYSYGRNLDVKDENKSSKVTRTSEVEYIQLPAKEEEEEEDDGKAHANYHQYGSSAYGNVEYKTISEDDLKAYYNNLDYAALSGGSHAHDQNGYRQQKSLEDGSKPSEALHVVPVPALLNPDKEPPK